MALTDILRDYLGTAGSTPNPNAAEHYDQAVAAAPPGVVSDGIATAMRSNQTPGFGQIVSQMFSHGTPDQRGGMLSSLLNSLNPNIAAAIGGPLGSLAGSNAPITAQQAAVVTPEQVQQAATQAEQHDPGIVDRMSEFYAQHTGLVKTLGSAALTIALARMANRR